MHISPANAATVAMSAKMLSRREMLTRSGIGLGALALTMQLADEGRLQTEAGEPANGSGTAKSVIFLLMGGGPSQVDTFDPKPELNRLQGQDVPESIAAEVPRIARAPLVNLLQCPYKFRRYGESGIPVSDLFPAVAHRVDDLCIIRSMRHPSPIHAPAQYLSTTGTLIGDRPCLGSWITYGLGSENRDLPGFIVINSDGTPRPPAYSSGFLPARYQGTVVEDGKIANLEMPAAYSDAARRRQLQLIERLNQRHLQRHQGQSELEARIRSYEMAFRMQLTAPEAFDVNGETSATQQLYGIDREESREFGRHCLLARRLVERGVRFIQLRTGQWDAHGKLEENHSRKAAITDQPIAGLLADLKQRGLLEQTLVIWGGEFGRTPTAQGSGASAGRDHSPSGYTMWLAGGGIRGGQIIGATDPVGYAAIERPVHPNDLHATILHALGIDQHELYYEHHNRRELVTVNGGTVLRDIFA